MCWSTTSIHEAAGHLGHAFLCLLVEDTAFMDRGGQGTNIQQIKEEEDWARNQKKAFSSAEKMRGCPSWGECVSAPQQPCCHPFASAADRKGMVMPGSYCAGEEFGPKSRQKSTRRRLSRGWGRRRRKKSKRKRRKGLDFAKLQIKRREKEKIQIIIIKNKTTMALEWTFSQLQLKTGRDAEEDMSCGAACWGSEGEWGCFYRSRVTEETNNNKKYRSWH